MKWLLLSLLMLPAAALAQHPAAEQARAAVGRLDAAVAELEAAQTGRDRVRALAVLAGAASDPSSMTHA